MTQEELDKYKLDFRLRIMEVRNEISDVLDFMQTITDSLTALENNLQTATKKEKTE